jgi:uncharacterized protein YndB with AHSA1/START domain
MTMTSSRSIRVSVDINAPQAVVWARVSDHEDTPSWVDAVKRVTLAQTGTPRNGLGAVRVVRFKPKLWTTIHERITTFEPPHVFDYVLFKGMPALVSHLGRISVDDLGGERSRLNWDVDFVFRTIHPFRLFLPSFLREFDAVLRTAVSDLKAQLEGG